MVIKLGNNAASVTIKELGVNCWHPRRFVTQGSRCDRLYRCKYPELRKCQAIHAEIAYYQERQRQMMKLSGEMDTEIEKLTKMIQK
uniref:Uncharacterized protein n=1 Tax=viral metagenome TaxID=1070528 RepID=A0A6M3X569_9ZZZZ